MGLMLRRRRPLARLAAGAAVAAGAHPWGTGPDHRPSPVPTEQTQQAFAAAQRAPAPQYAPAPTHPSAPAYASLPSDERS